MTDSRPKSKQRSAGEQRSWEEVETESRRHFENPKSMTLTLLILARLLIVRRILWLIFMVATNKKTIYLKALFLLLFTMSSVKADEIVTVNTRTDVTQSFLLLEPINKPVISLGSE
jgi:hypothetical protein